MSDSCDPMDCSLPDSSVHGILQARILEWVAISFSRGSSRPRDRIWVSCIEIESEVAQSCPTLCDPMDCNLPGSSVHEFFKARVLEWVVISSPAQQADSLSLSHQRSPTRPQTPNHAVEVRNLNHWIAREVPWGFLNSKNIHSRRECE